MAGNDLSLETKIFERHKAEFERDHPWEWIVIHGDDYVEFFEDFQVAAQTAVARFGRGPYLIRQIGVPTPSLPASVLFRPVDADH
jgi:hypothetical protein